MCHLEYFLFVAPFFSFLLCFYLIFLLKKSETLNQINLLFFFISLQYLIHSYSQIFSFLTFKTVVNMHRVYRLVVRPYRDKYETFHILYVCVCFLINFIIICILIWFKFLHFFRSFILCPHKFSGYFKMYVCKWMRFCCGCLLFKNMI